MFSHSRFIIFSLTLIIAFSSYDTNAQQALPTIDVGKRKQITSTKPARPTKPIQTAQAPLPAPPAAAPTFIPQGEQLWRGPTNVNGYFAGGTSTATKTNTKIIDIPQSVTIITQQQLQDRNSLTLNQALSYVPGVTVTQGEGNTDAITIRGQATTSNFYTDNVRDDAEYYRDLYATQSVEVLKGPSAIIL